MAQEPIPKNPTTAELGKFLAALLEDTLRELNMDVSMRLLLLALLALGTVFVFVALWNSTQLGVLSRLAQHTALQVQKTRSGWGIFAFHMARTLAKAPQASAWFTRRWTAPLTAETSTLQTDELANESGPTLVSLRCAEDGLTVLMKSNGPESEWTFVPMTSIRHYSVKGATLKRIALAVPLTSLAVWIWWSDRPWLHSQEATQKFGLQATLVISLAVVILRFWFACRQITIELVSGRSLRIRLPDSQMSELLKWLRPVMHERIKKGADDIVTTYAPSTTSSMMNKITAALSGRKK